MTSPQSIYATPACASTKTRDARRAQQQRLDARRAAALQDGPTRRLERLGPVLSLLRRYREGEEGGTVSSPLATFVRELGAEVGELERWTETLPSRHHRSGTVVRQALDFLRVFGRLTTLDFSVVPEEDRPHLVTLLALEHRWCYAAAGTTRDAFKAATGRTGAR
ncbi:MAG: hypothetical protein H6730_02655 [Deltaproteobacteria bacterium]|nr:hypothetical protein [Deltaproteobacteria bacterium]